MAWTLSSKPLNPKLAAIRMTADKDKEEGEGKKKRRRTKARSPAKRSGREDRKATRLSASKVEGSTAPSKEKRQKPKKVPNLQDQKARRLAQFIFPEHRLQTGERNNCSSVMTCFGDSQCIPVQPCISLENLFTT